LSSPAIALLTAYTDTLAHTYGNPVVAGHVVLGTLNYYYILLGFFGPDLLLTTYAVISTRRLSLLLLSPFFPFMRFIDAYITIRSIWSAFHTHSDGSWVSPVRRTTSAPSVSGRHHLHLVPPPQEERAS